MLDSFFSPASIAVIGASRTPGKVGHDIVKNLIDCGYDGPIYPVNPKGDEILGRECYSALDEIGAPVELAVIAIPARAVLGAIDRCAAMGTRAVIVISAGFKEAGEEGAQLERELLEKCRQAGIRCIGPNCLGVISPPAGLNASFGTVMPEPGNIAFFSQSGALGTAILDVCAGEGIGVSRFVSYGNKADVNETDLMQALAEDEETAVILGYVESIDDGRKFMDAAARVTRRKPVIIFKSGRTEAGARAAASHTGSLAGSDSTYGAAFRQCGIVRAESIEEFFDYARAFAAQPPPEGPGIAVVTNAGGPGIIATDAVELSRLSVAELSEETRRSLLDSLPPQANTRNPVDVLGDAKADRYRRAIEAVVSDDNVASILTVLTPQTTTEVEETAGAVADVAAQTGKTMLASFMGSASVGEGWRILDGRGVPNFEQPDRAVRALDAMLEYSLWRKTTPAEPPSYEFDVGTIRQVIDEARAGGLEALGERQAQRVVAACGIPVPQTMFATDEGAVVAAAGRIGYPVALKVSAAHILHKTDAGGVLLGLEGEGAVRDGFRKVLSSARADQPGAQVDGVLVQQMARPGREVIVGVNRDPQFGPVIMFGLGGIHVEVLKDVVFRVAPITQRDAAAMVAGIRSAAILGAFRGEAPADVGALAECITRVSQLAVQFPELTECDLNPVVVYPEGQGILALDVRFGLRP